MRQPSVPKWVTVSQSSSGSKQRGHGCFVSRAVPTMTLLATSRLNENPQLVLFHVRIADQASELRFGA
jgi:hypothetical protein